MVTEICVPVSIAYKAERIKFEDVYLYFCRNKYISYEEFFLGLEKIFKKSVDVTQLKEYFEYVKFNFSSVKAHEMSLILDYVLAKELHDNMMEENLKKEVDKIVYRSCRLKNNFFLTKEESKKRNDPNDDRIVSIKEDMRLVLDEKKSTKELVKEGRIQTKGLLTKIRKELKHLDKDEFIEFLVVENDLPTTSMKEIDQYIFTLEFFIRNIKENIKTLANIDYSKEEEVSKIYNIYISGEDELADAYSQNAKKFCVWKLNKLKLLLEKYNIALKTLIEMKNFKDVKSLSIYDTNLIKTISKEDDLIINYVKDLLKIYRGYERSIKTINTVCDESKEEIKDKYIKRLIFENND